MILVLLGTQNNSFKRLLDEIQRNIDNGNINVEVVVQKGYTKFESKDLKLYDHLSVEEIKELIKKADLVITHGGVGSIITAINLDKKVIAVPRLGKYNEHVNDHQMDIIDAFNEKGYIIGTHGVEDLESALKRAKECIPVKYEKNTGNILKIVEEFIENN